MTTLVLPKMLAIPPKLLPVIEKFSEYRYFLLEGGRGGGKSQTVARFLLYLAEKYRLRIVCGREIQNSINESVYTLLSDLVQEYQLNFNVQASKITHNQSESPFNFRGFREQGAFNIQGLEGVSLLWIDEAQAITKQTLDVLIPTIRKDQAKIFFTMNRHLKDDPVYEFLKDRSDCLRIHIDYTENPFCTQALKKEAEVCRVKDYTDYEHIWLGIPWDKSEDAVFSNTDLDHATTNIYPLREGYGTRIAGFDVARYGDDKCAAVIIQQMGALNWEVIHVEQWEHRDLNYTTGRILQIATEKEANLSIIDEDGLGAGPLDTLNKGRELHQFIGFRNPPVGYEQNKNYANPRTENTYKVKDMINQSHLRITDRDILKELGDAFRYEFDNYQRKRLISKDILRNKYKIKSPNTADALIMAVSQIGKVKQQQDRQYTYRATVSRGDNLFKLAGVR